MQENVQKQCQSKLTDARTAEDCNRSENYLIMGDRQMPHDIHVLSKIIFGAWRKESKYYGGSTNVHCPCVEARERVKGARWRAY